ncbi:MAG: type II toxin-antitoxin system HicA family toxin [Proteobacteria bacterium]|nr:type II toxin-antitoxin system HicA family toxin [Pseudomonadota bacterium]
MKGFYNEVIAILKKNGYSFYRQGKGSHEFWCKNGKDCVSVPVNLKARPLLLKQIGSKERV